MKKILLILIILPTLIFAQEYTLEQLIETGLEKSYDIQNEIASNKNSARSLRRKISTLMPSILSGIVAHHSPSVKASF